MAWFTKNTNLIPKWFLALSTSIHENESGEKKAASVNTKNTSVVTTPSNGNTTKYIANLPGKTHEPEVVNKNPRSASTAKSTRTVTPARKAVIRRKTKSKMRNSRNNKRRRSW